MKEQLNLPVNVRHSAEKCCPNQTKIGNNYEVITSKNHHRETSKMQEIREEMVR